MAIASADIIVLAARACAPVMQLLWGGVRCARYKKRSVFRETVAGARVQGMMMMRAGDGQMFD